MAKIQSMTLARLVNLGGYEHERFEFTVGVEEGEDPGAVFVFARELLEDIATKPPHEELAIREAKRIIADPDSDQESIAESRVVLEAMEKYKARKAGIADRLRGLGGFSVNGTPSFVEEAQKQNWMGLLKNLPGMTPNFKYPQPS